MNIKENNVTTLATSVLNVLVSKTNMSHVDRLVKHYSKATLSNLSSNERTEFNEYIRESVIPLRKALDGFEERLIEEYRKNNIARCELMLESLERQLGFYRDYHLPESKLWKYILQNNNGKYKTYIFQTSSAELFYGTDINLVDVEKNIYTEDSVGHAEAYLQQCWSSAWDQLLELKREFQLRTQGRLVTGKAVRTPFMEEIWERPEMLKTELQKLIAKGKVERNEERNNYTWCGKKKELSEQYWIWFNRGYFKKKISNPDRGRAILTFFNIESKKSTAALFQKSQNDI